jgi:hypothetical protein
MQPVQFNFADPSQAILGGIKQGALLGQIRQETQANELQMQIARQKAAQAQQQQQAALQQQTDLRTLAMNPNATHADYARLMTTYPELSENLGKSFKVLEEGQQQNLLNFQSRIYSAQLAGNNELAVEMLRERSKADPAQAQHYDTLATLIEKNPAAGRSIAALSLAGAMGPEKFAEAFAKIGGEQRAAELQPFTVKKAEGDADSAVSDAVIKREQAKTAPQAALLDLQKKGWDITKIQADIEHQRESNRISAMNAAIAKQGNDLKRRELELKVQEAEGKLSEKVRERVATAEAGAANIDNMLNTVERVKKNKSLNSVLGSLEGNEYYPNATLGTLNPGGDGDERADAVALIENLKSQAFLAQIPNIKGMGALSNAEGEKLQAALQNLSRKQSEKQFRDNLDEASRLLKKGRENLSRSTGVPLPKPDTPAAPGARPPLSSFEGKK